MITEEQATRIAKRIAKRGEHTLLIGPPGIGATSIARRVVDHLPYPGDKQAGIDGKERSQIYRVAGLDRNLQRRVVDTGLPFRAPHPTISLPALIGVRPDPVTWCPQYGELTLAHTGVLFLDEAPEFHSYALGGVALALSNGKVTHGTRTGNASYPTRFLLIAHRYPCPCGRGVGDRKCDCSNGAIQRYVERIKPIRKHLTHVIDLRTEDV